jgi:hypothetical protein
VLELQRALIRKEPGYQVDLSVIILIPFQGFGDAWSMWYGNVENVVLGLKEKKNENTYCY